MCVSVCLSLPASSRHNARGELEIDQTADGLDFENDTYPVSGWTDLDPMNLDEIEVFVYLDSAHPNIVYSRATTGDSGDPTHPIYLENYYWNDPGGLPAWATIWPTKGEWEITARAFGAVEDRHKGTFY